MSAESAKRGLAEDVWEFLKHNKRWWLAPIVIALLILGALFLFGGSTAGPFVYDSP